MKALVYGVAPEPVAVPDDANPLVQNLARTPTGLRDVPEPVLPHEDWVLTRPRLTGICGSDAKQILMDFGEGDADNAMSAFCSFPQVMGHEVVADVVALGPDALLDDPLAEPLVRAPGWAIGRPSSGRRSRPPPQPTSSSMTAVRGSCAT
ncbi:alcohol dehydrogenase catalytic domain-containing protein, partial [Mycobacterium avium]|uniref:alcohol dehydrogenase catalytic domain-containing protein n=1 Tax=Mycobacterium avium TaxID=1764 RepID=UPI0020C9EBAB